MSDKEFPKLHLFICTNQKERGECCAQKNAAALRDELKSWCKSQPELASKVRVNASGCLGCCEKGIAAVLYPKGEWRLELTDSEESKTQLKQLLLKAAQTETD